MELACHIGPNSQWDARTVELGIVAGQSQWQHRLRAPETASCPSSRPSYSPPWNRFRAGANGSSYHTRAGCLSRPRRQTAGVIDAATALAKLDAFESPVSFETSLRGVLPEGHRVRTRADRQISGRQHLHRRRDEARAG